jgi:hypothetical protein
MINWFDVILNSYINDEQYHETFVLNIFQLQLKIFLKYSFCF